MLLRRKTRTFVEQTLCHLDGKNIYKNRIQQLQRDDNLHPLALLPLHVNKRGKRFPRGGRQIHTHETIS